MILRDDDRSEFLGTAQSSARLDRVFPTRGLDTATGDLDVLSSECALHFVHRQAIAGHAQRVDPNAKFALATANKAVTTSAAIVTFAVVA